MTKASELTECTLPDCSEPFHAKELCRKHYNRLKATGDPYGVRVPGKTPTTPASRVLARVTQTDRGCWLWTGARNQDGYGRIGSGSRADGTRTQLTVHRVVYEDLVGPIPDGWHVDHLCRVPSCVNPTHLEAVDHDTNHERRKLTAEQHFALRLELRR